MKKTILLTIILVSIVKIVCSQDMPHSQNLTCAFVGTGKNFHADGGYHYSTWVNNTGAPVFLRKVRLFWGMNRDEWGDVVMNLYKAGVGCQDGAGPQEFVPHTLIFAAGGDHYENSALGGEQIMDFAPDWIEIGPGEGIQLKAMAHAFNTPSGDWFLPQAWIWILQ